MGLSSDRSRADGTFSAIVMACAAITGAMGLWVMGRWQLGLPPLLPAYRDLPPIQPLTATCLALWSVALFAAEQRMRPLVNLACLVLVSVATLRLYQAVLGQDFAIDKLLFPNAFSGGDEHLRVHAGMTLTTAFGLLCLAGAVAGRPYAPGLAAGLLIFPACAAVVALLSIGFQAAGPDSLIANVVPALAAIGGSLVAMTGAICLDPRPRWLSRLFSNDVGAASARRLLAMTIPVAVGLAWLIRTGHSAGRFDVDGALALTAAGAIALLAFAAIWPLRETRSAADFEAEPLEPIPEPLPAEAFAAEPAIEEVTPPAEPITVEVEPSLAAASPAAVAAQALELTRPRATERGLNLILTAGSLPPQALIDATRLREVLLNLLDNAVTFTESGDVCLGCDYDADSETLSFAVMDTGRGIAPEAAARLFRRAHGQSDDTGDKGRGLAISKSLVEAMGGEIWLTSVPGEGSTFSFVVPARPVSAEESLVQTDGHGA